MNIENRDKTHTHQKNQINVSSSKNFWLFCSEYEKLFHIDNDNEKKSKEERTKVSD